MDPEGEAGPLSRLVRPPEDLQHAREWLAARFALAPEDGQYVSLFGHQMDCNGPLYPGLAFRDRGAILLFDGQDVFRIDPARPRILATDLNACHRNAVLSGEADPARDFRVSVGRSGWTFAERIGSLR